MMNFDEIITYLNITGGDQDKLKSFFEKEDVKEFILQKWDEYNLPVMPPVIDEPEEFTSQDIDSVLTKQEFAEGALDDLAPIDNPINEIEMPIIPNIPEDSETEKAKCGEFNNSQDLAFDSKFKNKFIQLQNGKVNYDYSCLFDITNLGMNDIGDFWFEGLEEIGLTFNLKTDLIVGTPIVAGDHKVKLKCKRVGWKEGDPIFERTITLIINPDPRSLWNNIPTPEDIEYYRPDSDKDYVKVETSSGFLGFGKKERKDVVAASQRGRSHAHEGTPRDDDFKISFQSESDWYVMVVADGAGSAKYSRAGANIACTTVSDFCNKEFTIQSKEIEELIKKFNKEESEANRKTLGDMLYNTIGVGVFKAYKDIEKEAQEKGASMRDYSTTLLVTVAKNFKFGWFVASFWVGDGAIAIYNKDTQFLKIMGDSDGGEFAGQTRFLTMPEIMDPTEIYRRLRFEIVEDFTALMLMSDGITDPKFETDSNLQKIEKWNALWEDLSSAVDLVDDNEESADQLLKWLDFWSQGNHDDRTIVIMY